MREAAADVAELLDAPGSRRAALSHGRTLTVRPLRSGDVAGLHLLYEGLSLDDRYHRFFSVYHPPPAALEHLVDTVDGPGCGLVAIVSDAHGTEETVGEATCTPLPDGAGELGITVAKVWRGWLGPFLLDALVEAAAANGCPRIEADVLRENRAMVAILRARGASAGPGSDASIVHLTIPTGVRPQPAPASACSTR
jgi:acetyltransferase